MVVIARPITPEQKAMTNKLNSYLRLVVQDLKRNLGKVYDLKTLREFIGKASAHSLELSEWADAIAFRMVKTIDAKNIKFMANLNRRSSWFARILMKQANFGLVGKAMERARLSITAKITSLPEEAANKARALAEEAAFSGMRASTFKNRVLEIGEITESKAALIARTEISRATTMLTEARARTVGSDGYIWHSSKDGRVRESHEAMDGKFVRWDDPPTLDGLTGHAGELPNCRCWPEPVLRGNEDS